MKIEYRLIVGERGNETGHVVNTKARTLAGAKRCLARELSAYEGDGWGYIETRMPFESWTRLED